MSEIPKQDWKWPVTREERIKELENIAPFYKGTPHQENIVAAIAWHATFSPNETAPGELTFFQNGRKVEESQMRFEDGQPWVEVGKGPEVYYFICC